MCITKTHIRHDNDIRHLNLTKSERKELATKIASKIPFENILEVRDSICDLNLQRFHLLTKKDLYNIEKSFKLISSIVNQYTRMMR